jgi:hypothetical protein
MTTEDKPLDGEKSEEEIQAAADAAKTADLATKTAEEQIAALREERQVLIKVRDSAKRKAREQEKLAEERLLIATGYKEKLVTKVVSDSLKQTLVDAGALSIDTALKLIDKNKVKLDDDFNVDMESIKELVEAMRVSDPVLFKAKESVKEDGKKEAATQLQNSLARAGEKATIESAYKTAINNAKSTAQIEAVMKQFGKITH